MTHTPENKNITRSPEANLVSEVLIKLGLPLKCAKFVTTFRALLLLFVLTGCTSTPPPDTGRPLAEGMQYQLAPSDDWDVIVKRIFEWLESDQANEIRNLEIEQIGDHLEESLLQPLEEDNMPFFDRIEHGYAPENTTGIVTVQTIDCPWETVEKVLMDSDQSEIFPATWEDHEREYLSDPAEYEEGRESLSFPSVPLDTPIDPSGEHIDLAGLARSILVVEDSVDPTSVHNINVGEYGTRTSARHGCNEGKHYASIRGFNIDEALTNGTGLFQSYWFSMYIGDDDLSTTRISAVWTEKALAGSQLGGDFVTEATIENNIMAGDDLETVCQSR